MYYIGIDIGGTKIKYGLVDDEGNILEFMEMDTEAKKGRRGILEKIAYIINYFKNKYDIKGVGISTAGQVNSLEGIIKYATETLPNWTGTELKKFVEDNFGVGCEVENDVNAAALGELWKGAGRNENDFACITLGTGIGGAIVIDKKIFSGANFSAGEFGHMQIEKNGILCSCGARGCYEAYASTNVLVNTLRDKTADISLEGMEIFERAKKGESPYIETLELWIDNISDGLKNIVSVLNPKLLLIGGGVTGQGDYLLEKIRISLKSKIMPSFYEDLELKFTECGNRAGLLGAVYHFLQKNKRDW